MATKRDPVPVELVEPDPVPVRIVGSLQNAAPPSPNQMTLPTTANTPQPGGQGQGSYQGFFGGLAKWVDDLDVWKKANREFLIGLTKFVSIIGTAGSLLADAISLSAYRIAKASEIAALRISGKQQEAEVAELEMEKGTFEKVVNWKTGAAVGAIIGSVAPGPGTLVGGIVGGIAGEIGNMIGGAIFDHYIQKEKEFITQRDALRGRGEHLRGYDARLGQTFAVGQMNQVKRDIGEAGIIGGKLAEVEARQQQLDLINQQISILNRIEESGKQMERLNEKILEQQEKLDESLKNVDANTAEMVRKLQEAAKTPLDQLEEMGRFNTGENGGWMREREIMRQAAEDRLNIPAVVGGI